MNLTSLTCCQATLNAIFSGTFAGCTFNGKEKDYESGFHYYGARYYWSEVLTGWMSVDPMADKYPSLSPYNYCAWNPVKLVDPDGMDTIISFACRTSNSEYNKKNAKILKWMRNLENSPYLLTVALHGSPQQMEASANESGTQTTLITPSVLANKIESGWCNSFLYEDNLEKNKPTVIILYSCTTGKGENCFGQQLSELLESSIVIAPVGSVWVTIINGKNYISNREAIPNGDGTFRPGPPRSWGVFYKGKRVLSFGYFAPQSWIMKQGGLDKFIKNTLQQYENKKNKK